MEDKNNNLDLRIKRTRKLLSKALLELMTEKSFDEIKISDICTKAMVHRTTFYKHFEDKYNLLNYCLKDLMNKFEEKALSIPSSIENPRQYYVNLFKIILEHMKENKKLYFIGLDNLRNHATINIFQKTLSQCIYYRLNENIKFGISFEIPIEVMSEIFSSSMISIGIWWLDNSMPISIDKLIVYVDKMIGTIAIEK